ALGLTATGTPSALRGRRLWMAAILISGCCAVTASVWLARRGAEETSAIAGTSAAPKAPTVQPSVAGLTFRIKVLEDRVKELEAGGQARSIPQQTADGLA